MSRERFSGKPFLIARSDMPGHGNMLGHPTEEWDETTAKALERPQPKHGAAEAAELLLSVSGVQISFVDVNDPGRKIWEDSPTRMKRAKLLLGFNDHAGGSESDHKIMLNRFGGRSKAGKYVLHSPPGQNGVPTNTVFYRGDFTFLTWEPSTRAGRYETCVPNPLKTFGHAKAQGYQGYEYYLVGSCEDRSSLVRAFRAAGFTFVPRPMDEKMHNRIKYELTAPLSREKPEDFVHYSNWPNGETGAEPPKGQFAQQIARLRIAEAIL